MVTDTPGPDEVIAEREAGPPRVVILGGGYGGIYTALGLQKAARRADIHLSIISRDNFFLSQPMLAEVVSGSIEPPHIVSPIRRLCPQCDFHQAEIEDVDLDQRQVVIRYPDQPSFRYIPFDHLVIAVGAGTDLSRIPGMAPHSFSFKTLGDAMALRSHLIGVLEKADVEEDAERKERLLTFVVAGGGYTGVEVVAEINDFVREAARSYRHVDPSEARVLLLQGASRILPELDDGPAAFSHRVLERRGIEIRLNTRVAGATGEGVFLNDGSDISARTLVAAIGASGNRLLEKLPCPRDQRGRLIVDSSLAVEDYPGLWSIGDCAAVPDTVRDGTCPPTAQYAIREARHVAKNIMAAVKGSPVRPFSYNSLGVFVPLGRFSGAAQIMGINVSGLLAWWLYRSYYLFQLPRLKRKIQVFIDWNLELLFRRDIVHLDITRSQQTTRSHYEPGQIVFNQGDLARGFFIILEGEVQVVRLRGEVEELVATMGPGEYFGEISLLFGVRHTATIRALTPLDLLIMNGNDFTALANSSADFRDLLGGVMRQRLSDAGVESPEEFNRPPQGEADADNLS
ncbi:MAG: hypothetical protein BZY88_04305 [SAR202 cluster bacterium Io17-Chloro-G9]|nr:MAG: hypothetical protein BZY88_04305 [SAR202 cluster bacterium Io17-Chloro-G9]